MEEVISDSYRKIMKNLENLDSSISVQRSEIIRSIKLPYDIKVRKLYKEKEELRQLVEEIEKNRSEDKLLDERAAEIEWYNSQLKCVQDRHTETVEQLALNQSKVKTLKNLNSSLECSLKSIHRNKSTKVKIKPQSSSPMQFHRFSNRNAPRQEEQPDHFKDLKSELQVVKNQVQKEKADINTHRSNSLVHKRFFNDCWKAYYEHLVANGVSPLVFNIMAEKAKQREIGFHKHLEKASVDWESFKKFDTNRIFGLLSTYKKLSDEVTDNICSSYQRKNQKKLKHLIRNQLNNTFTL